MSRWPRQRVTVELTAAQAWAAITAIESYTQAGDYDEQLAMFGSPQSVTAAFRAASILSRALYKPSERKHSEAE